MSVTMLPLPALLGILFIVWNLGVLCLFGLDKRAAIRGLWRVPERRLVIAIILFGALGAFIGQRLFRHKTRKAPFNWLVPAMLTIQIVALAALGLVRFSQNSWP